MSLLCDLEIDAACSEFLRARGYDVPQPVVIYLDAEPEENEEEIA